MPAARLQLVDWVVIASYFLALVLIGLYYRRFAVRSVEDYFLSGRRNSGWANGVSYAAALMNADVAPAYSGLAAVTGLFICWWYLTRFGLALFVGAMLFAVFWRRLNLFTTPEFYELRFGGPASNIMRTWVALRSSLIAMVAWTGTGLLAMYKIAGPVLNLDALSGHVHGWTGVWLSPRTLIVLIVVPIVLAYVGAAGFSGVVATAGLQSLIMFIGSVMLCGIVLYHAGGPETLAANLESIAGGQALQALPPPGHAVFPLAAAIVYLVGSSIGYGGDTAPLGGAMEGQYLLSSRNTKEASRMYLVAEITLFVLLLLVTLPALGAVVVWPGLRTGAIDREMAYGLLMGRYLPPGMLGLLLVVMLAAVMSTIASNLNFGAQVLVSDIYRRYLRPHETDAHYMWIGRMAIVLILALALLVVYHVELIFEVAVFMLAFSAAELPANWAQWWWWRFNRWGRLAASFGAPIILLVVRRQLPAWPWWDQTYLVMGLNTVLWISVTLLTPADSPAVLERFYRRARPLGAWGRVKRQLPGTDAVEASEARAGIGLIFAGCLLALLGAASTALFVLGISHLYVGRYLNGLGELIGAGLGGGLFLLLYGRYLQRLEDRAGVTSSQPRPCREPSPPATACEPAQPAPTSVVVAVAAMSYGLLMMIIGLAGTRGADTVLNVLAGLAFALSAVLVWRLGRPSGPAAPDSSSGPKPLVSHVRDSEH